MKSKSFLNSFQRFIKLCAGRTGRLINFSSIGNEIGINYKTVSSWISILEASFIVCLLKPHYKNFNKRLVKPKQSKLSTKNRFLIYGGLKKYQRSAAKVLSWKNYAEIA